MADSTNTGNVGGLTGPAQPLGSYAKKGKIMKPKAKSPLAHFAPTAKK